MSRKYSRKDHLNLNVHEIPVCSNEAERWKVAYRWDTGVILRKDEREKTTENPNIGLILDKIPYTRPPHRRGGGENKMERKAIMYREKRESKSESAILRLEKEKRLLVKRVQKCKEGVCWRASEQYPSQKREVLESEWDAKCDDNKLHALCHTLGGVSEATLPLLEVVETDFS